MLRNATREDIPAMLALGELMHKESIYAGYEYNKEKVSNLISWLIDSPKGIVFVSEQDGVIQGGFMGSIDEHWFGTEPVANDYALFLAPEHRKGRLAVRLISEYIQQAKAKGAVQIMLANSTGVQIEGVARLYEAMGFEKRGYVYEFKRGV